MIFDQHKCVYSVSSSCKMWRWKWENKKPENSTIYNGMARCMWLSTVDINTWISEKKEGKQEKIDEYAGVGGSVTKPNNIYQLAKCLAYVEAGKWRNRNVVNVCVRACVSAVWHRRRKRQLSLGPSAGAQEPSFRRSKIECEKKIQLDPSIAAQLK